MARRRKGLGSSPEVHESKMQPLLDVARAEAENAVDHLSKGNCAAAIRAVARGYFAAGRADAHGQSAGRVQTAYSPRLDTVISQVALRCSRK
jgi:hypothetical protein